MKIINKFIKNGTKFLLPQSCIIDNSVWIDSTCVIGKNCEINKSSCVLENCVIDNSTLTNVKVGKNCTVKNCYLQNCEIKDNTSLIFAYIENSKIGSDCTVGPFCIIKNNSVVENKCRVGSFVEVKSSVLKDNVKSAHLAYIGDAEVGSNSNIGCGVVFANYNGTDKNKTVVGKNNFIGANVNLVAPLEIKDNCYIGAGTTVSDNIEAEIFMVEKRQYKKYKNKKIKTG